MGNQRGKSAFLTGVMAILICGLILTAAPLEASSKVRLNKTKATLTVGKTLILKMKGTKKKAKWSSSKKRVATVSSKGKVKAKKAGKTTITARIGKKKYRCKITVKKKAGNKSTQNNTEQASTDQSNTEQTTTDPDKKDQVTTQEDGQPGIATKNYDAGEYSITKVHSGEGTFYDQNSGGAANLDYMGKTFYTAAMNNEDYMNGLAGAYIEITDKDGDKIKVVITDRLPEGKKGDIDLTRKAFKAIEPEVTGRMKITWKIIPLPTTEPISYVFKPTSSQSWAEVQVRNGRYPIKKLEYYNKTTGKFVELPRQEYNYFTAKNGMGEAPYTFRVTDFYGHTLTDSNIFINTTSTPVPGKANFPY